MDFITFVLVSKALQFTAGIQQMQLGHCCESINPPLPNLSFKLKKYLNIT
jgi:hypothetical protein